MRQLGLQPDPWQIEVLESTHPRLLLNCARQAGKSTVVALLAVFQAIWQPGTKVLLVSNSHRQSRLLFQQVAEFYRRLGSPFRHRQTREELHLGNLSEVISLPSREETIRGYSGVGLLVIDEAARVRDELYRAVRPMLAVSGGRLFCLSTPHGKRGFFHHAWVAGGTDWHRIQAPASQIPRMKRAILEADRREFGEAYYRQEYECSFEALEGLVYPDFARCVVRYFPAHLVGPDGRLRDGAGQKVGGLDFGLRNPFAAVWGVVDRDDVLWLTGEHFSRERTLAYHAQHLPRDVMWYGDPNGAREIRELTCAGFKIRAADNAVAPGIQAVKARLEDEALKVLAGACPNLLEEAGLYRYDPEDKGRSEIPLKEYDHAMDALRYLIATFDVRRMAKIRKQPLPPESPAGSPPAAAPAKLKRKWLRLSNEALWTTIWTIDR
jgi:hypothetical protein